MTKGYLLKAAGVAAIVGPLVAGVLNPSKVLAQVRDEIIIRQDAAQPQAAGGAETKREFEVASVKPNKSGGGQVMIGTDPRTGRFNTVNVPLRMLIRFAYQLQDFQVVGGPSWITSDRFDIVAKADGEIGPAPIGTVGPVQLMLRSLLADRFKLTVHFETRELPIYSLVVARADGKLGAQLRPAAVDCAALA
ncbi:MAG: TIGR03435 family protein, partial [Vicinamibacterales bacterium]